MREMYKKFWFHNAEWFRSTIVILSPVTSQHDSWAFIPRLTIDNYSIVFVGEVSSS